LVTYGNGFSNRFDDPDKSSPEREPTRRQTSRSTVKGNQDAAKGQKRSEHFFWIGS